MSARIHAPGTCSCCGAEDEPELANRPGLSELEWRAGTHASFLGRMKARLPEVQITDGPNAGSRPLVDLTARSPDDFTMGLLDACAITADVLTFYTERIANEGYLRTATERRSVLEIARTLGYELRPGVAASAYVAFTVEDPLVVPGTLPQPTTVFVPAGSKVQSVPGPNELPQTFETVAEVETRAEWNAMRPRQRVRHELAIVSGTLYWRAVDGALTPVSQLWLAGDVTSLKEGDRLLVRVPGTIVRKGRFSPIAPMATAVVIVARTVAERPRDPLQPTYTRVELAGITGPTPTDALPSLPDGVPTTTPLAMTAATVRTWILGRSWTEEALQTFLSVQGWQPRALITMLEALAAAAAQPELLRFKQRLGAFGHSAPAAAQVAAAFESGRNPWRNWDDPADPTTVWTTSGSFVDVRSVRARRVSHPARPLYSDDHAADLFLERVVELSPGGWTLLETASATAPFKIEGVMEATLADFAMSGKATGLAFGLGDTYKRTGGASFTLRGTTVHVGSEALPLATAPVLDPVGKAGNGVTRLVLDRMTIGLRPGQMLAINGETVDEAGKATGVVVSELVELASIRHVGGVTVLTLRTALAHGYTRTSLTITANVALATHGETVKAELLGSGDAARANQSFVLKRPPVTWVSAPTPSGTASTIQVEVDGTPWHERSSLWDAERNARAFMARTDDDGRTTITFGDGVRGARLPTGRDNVSATYRTGIGLVGQVPAGRLALMPQKPLGLRGVTNPVGAAGAQDPEVLEDARRNAPLTVLTLDRVVSRRDYEDFARSFAGIGKALASELWSGHRRIVHLTVAAADGSAVDPASTLRKNLHDAIVGASDPAQAFELASYVRWLFIVEGTLLVTDPKQRAAIEDAARARLIERYGFAAREIGQPVTAAELTADLQRLEGVVAVRLTRLHAAHEPPALRAALPAPSAEWHAATNTITPATLLAIQPLGIRIATQLVSGGSS